MGGVVDYMRNIVLPFARFAVNKKRSIYSDYNKLFRQPDANVRREGLVAMTGHLAELAAFHSINKILIPAIASLFVDDEEEESKFRKSPLLDIAGSVVADVNPLPPIGYLEDVVKEMINRHFLLSLIHI